MGRVTTWKRCTKCFETKPLNSYSKDKTGLYGRRANCKQCQNEQNQECRERRKQNKTLDGCCEHPDCGVVLSIQRIESEQQRIQEEKHRYGNKPGGDVRQRTVIWCANCEYIFTSTKALPPQERPIQRDRIRKLMQNSPGLSAQEVCSLQRQAQQTTQPTQPTQQAPEPREQPFQIGIEFMHKDKQTRPEPPPDPLAS